MHERDNTDEPYDGEVWSWSPAELNRITYVDGNGDLWVASADGRNPRRLLKGDFTLPAWSDDGKAIAVAEKKDGGRRWDISVVLLPQELRSPR
jgi:Tol biopolymer transport system component